MFTVCPKCALTLVVTAADLRVAQGYVRCGRCSNVFNALARLSEDRQAAAAAAAAAQSQPSQESAGSDARAAQTGASKSAPPAPQASGTFRTRAPDSSPTGRTRIDDLSASAVRKAPPAPPPSEPKRYDDDSIPEEDLEFNPDATDLNKVFVEQPPSPQFTAATGTFKAIRLEAQDTTRAEEPLARTDEREAPAGEPFDEDALDPTETQVDVEIDPDLLATMNQLTSNRLERLNPTPPQPTRTFSAFSEPKPAPAPPSATASPAPSAKAAAPAPPKSTPPAKQPMLLQPPMEQPPQAPVPMRLAERAKARAADSKLKPDTLKSDTSQAALQTTQAIRAALAPKRRAALSEFGRGRDDARPEPPTSFFAGMWTAGSVLLLLVLTIQVVHHYRHDLAANATLNGPLTSIYAVLGIPLVPRWDLTAYEVRQLGASTAADAPGQITVRASVKNGARQAQPLPLLRVTLQDRFGNRIASQDVSPQSYLPRAIPRSSLLSAGQRIDAEMTFVDPGSNAVGFEIDACLPAPGGGISCANDAAR
ncbi:MAG: zinc-ribbon and DUF3426 domain-containing protein [Steroidobacteraceae bacterium]